MIRLTPKDKSLLKQSEVREWFERTSAIVENHMRQESLRVIAEENPLTFGLFWAEIENLVGKLEKAEKLLEKIATAAQSNSPDARYLGNKAREYFGRKPTPKKGKGV